ncbi:aminotransferase DegT [Candidatus Woesearchaeota archaeon]|jgi:perosamine synthetase|nr:aminotransferase DegT [Candidatus Woesearchaeota archaeon]MDP7244011.1 DegT/DnrJ/EryC1/StrS family aminotransferase [Flavobacteriales bacterium]
MLPVYEPFLKGNEVKYVMDCFKTNWISAFGKYNYEFEKTFAAYCGVKRGISVTSGTAALHLAVAALRIGKGDEVIIPDFTMIAPALAVAYQGAEPIFVDAEPKTWTIDVQKIEDKITKRTKAIIPVHIYGHPCDMNPIMKLAEKYNLKVIEDAAEAIGALYNGKKAGSFGDISAFSFYTNKVITTGEGGMVVTNDNKLADRVESLRNFCFDKERRYIHEEIGFKYPLTNIQAAIGLAQMEYIEDIIKKKIEVARTYNKLLKGIPGITLPYEADNVRNIYWMYGILIEGEFGVSRDRLKELLFKKGIETRFFFTGLHKQPPFKTEGTFPVSDALEKKGVYLPCSPHILPEQLEFVATSIKEAYNEHKQ